MRNPLNCTLLFFLIINGLAAQVSENVILKDRWTDPDLPEMSSLTFNDIWGYTDEVGNEYGIIGSLDYTHFIDLNDPNNITEITRIAGTSRSVWRDFKTYLHYAYGVADNGGACLQVFDLSGLPNTVTKIFDSTDFFTNCHNIYLEEKTGRLYAIGTGTANLVVLDLLNNPASPTLLKNVNLADGYIHDIYVRDNIAFASHIYRSKITVYDVSDLDNVQALGSLGTDGLNHSNWLTENGEILVLAEETKNIPVKLIDVTDYGDMSEIATFKSTLEAPNASNSIAHNPFVINDQYAVVSYYHDGVQIYDISIPENPTRAGYYDTYPSNTNYSGGEGSWGVFPFFPSNHIIASDIDSGFFMLQPTFDLGYCRKDLYTAHTVESGENSAVMAARSVNLRTGFHAKAGSDFSASITPCSTGNLQQVEVTKSNFDKADPIDNQPVRNSLPTVNLTSFPNPFQQNFRLLIDSPALLNIRSIRVFNQLGQSTPVAVNPCGDNCYTLHLKEQLNGVYSVILETEQQGNLQLKVLKQN